MVSFFLILESLNPLNDIWAKFWKANIFKIRSNLVWTLQDPSYIFFSTSRENKITSTVTSIFFNQKFLLDQKLLYRTGKRNIPKQYSKEPPLESKAQTSVNSLSISPAPGLSFLPALYRGWTRAGERRVQDNLHAHAQNEPIKNCQVPTTLLASMCRAMPFSARALKENIFFDVDIVIKNIKT